MTLGTRLSTYKQEYVWQTSNTNIIGRTYYFEPRIRIYPIASSSSYFTLDFPDYYIKVLPNCLLYNRKIYFESYTGPTSYEYIWSYGEGSNTPIPFDYTITVRSYSVCQYEDRVFTVDITPSGTSDLSLTYDDSAPYTFKWVDTDASLPVRLYEVTYTVKVTC